MKLMVVSVRGPMVQYTFVVVFVVVVVVVVVIVKKFVTQIRPK
jgi:hypothetical protein